MQNQLIMQVEPGWVEDGLPCISDVRIAGNAPGLVADQSAAIFASGVGGITIAVKPGL